jgi:hypothetical protein
MLSCLPLRHILHILLWQKANTQAENIDGESTCCRETVKVKQSGKANDGSTIDNRAASSVSYIVQ